MLSVVIATDNSEKGLLPTLSALVPGAAAGVVREVILADAGSRDATLKIADVAGCRVLDLPSAAPGARLKAGAAAAKASWLLFLRPGTILDTGWIAEVARFMEQSELIGQADAAVFRLGGTEVTRSALAEALVALRAALIGRPRPEQGLLITRRRYEGLGGHHATRSDAESDLLRRLGRPAVLRARALAAA